MLFQPPLIVIFGFAFRVLFRTVPITKRSLTPSYWKNNLPGELTVPAKCIAGGFSSNLGYRYPGLLLDHNNICGIVNSNSWNCLTTSELGLSSFAILRYYWVYRWRKIKHRDTLIQGSLTGSNLLESQPHQAVQASDVGVQQRLAQPLE